MPERTGRVDPDGKKWRRLKRIWIPELDTDVDEEIKRLRDSLKLEQLGADRGREQLPTQADKTLDEPQMEVCGRVFAGIHLLNAMLDERVSDAVKRARGEETPRVDAEQVREEAGIAINRCFEEHRPKLVELRRNDLSSQNNLRHFIHTNGLTRDAHYEESVVKVVGIIVGMFVLESVINGSLFAQVVADGLIGGAAIAGMISGVNILSGVCTGLWGWRNIGHRRTELKALGTVITLAVHSLAIYFNFVVAHTREVAERLAAMEDFNFDLSQLTTETATHISTHGLFGVGSLQSWALLLLGIFIHFIAAKEGWDDLADRYPDYKKYHLHACEAQRAFADGLAELRDDIRDALEEVESEAKQTLAAARESYETIAELFDIATERQQEVRDSEDEWVGGGNRLLKTYRDTNLKIRTPGTEPAYFATYPSAKDYRRRNFDADSTPSDEIEERTRGVAASIQELIALRDKAKGTAESAEAALKGVHRHVSNSLKEVDARIDIESLKITKEVSEWMDRTGLNGPKAPAEPTASATPMQPA
ncbi:hypothetical protein [Sphingomonas sp.]|jgi:hypothetical protein|uniref:hypothetical protein n=1 Tax=Sphingomonas sp. TaxID=28214 RepID=UPI002ED8697C